MHQGHSQGHLYKTMYDNCIELMYITSAELLQKRRKDVIMVVNEVTYDSHDATVDNTVPCVVWLAAAN